MVNLGKKRTILKAGVSLIGLAVLGCGQEENTVQQAGKTMVQGVTRAKDAKATADLHAIQTAIQEYQAANGRFPDRLEDLPLVQHQHLDLSSFVYDPSTGQVSLKP